MVVTHSTSNDLQRGHNATICENDLGHHANILQPSSMPTLPNLTLKSLSFESGFFCAQKGNILWTSKFIALRTFVKIIQYHDDHFTEK